MQVLRAAAQRFRSSPDYVNLVFRRFKPFIPAPKAIVPKADIKERGIFTRFRPAALIGA
jgi:hypothetical protein